jgi:hypothetical protein
MKTGLRQVSWNKKPFYHNIDQVGEQKNEFLAFVTKEEKRHQFCFLINRYRLLNLSFHRNE